MQPGSRASPIRPGIFVADSVTTPRGEVAGSVLIAGSHCGVYCGYLAARLQVRGIILNDAGIGLEQAGIAGLAYLQAVGIPAAAIDHESARIGDGADTAARGVVAWVNDAARAVNCSSGQTAIEAAMCLCAAPLAHGDAPELREARHAIELPGRRETVLALDSASLVSDEDEGRIVATASHGGLLGGDPKTALKVDARAVFFNDAGIGCDRAGISRLPELDRRGIIAGTVSHWTALIGDAMSSWETGVLSHVNRCAARAGAKPGMRLREFVAMVAR